MNLMVRETLADAPAPDPGADTNRLHLMVENVHCAGCIATIERAVTALPGVLSARVNLSTRRLAVERRPDGVDAERIVETVSGLGYPATPFDPGHLGEDGAAEDRRLLAALAVAGFAAGNVMLLSISVWSGFPGDMGAATRDMFHWISALIALPAVAYAGQPFFRSAFRALRGRSMNMDVPISVAVVLAAGMSLQQTIVGGDHTYFDASVSLLFFLLIGRYLDRRACAKARSAATRLVSLQAASATVVADDGSLRSVPCHDIEPGMTVLVAAGERLPVDGEVITGRSEIDTSLVTGESLPRPAGIGDEVFAGTVNLSQPLHIRVGAVGEQTLLAEIVRLMEAAEQRRTRYVRIADRLARIYAPAVHIVAAATFCGWLWLGAAGWQDALMAATAVLIITCPCALGLAVPVVQVVASGRLMRRGALMKSPDGLERLEAVDTVVFDKTGTLTIGQPALVDGDRIPAETLRIAAALAAHSRHPLSRAVAASAAGLAPIQAEAVEEIPGRGLTGRVDGRAYRLGARDWAAPMEQAAAASENGPEVWLGGDGATPQRFVFSDPARPDAAAIIAALKSRGLAVEMLSGDSETIVRRMAEELGIATWRAGCLPEDKVRRLDELADAGRRVLMVGDGLNDAPALAAGFASMSPSGAADISRTAADLVFQGERLSPVLLAVGTARKAGRLVRQNFALALAYNCIAVPLAVIGLATPLIAAIAMSASSLVVTLNALRLHALPREGETG